jgi:hypothetical protein
MSAVTHLAPHEPLSPELVLVLPEDDRAHVLARLGPPVRPTPRPRLRLVEATTPIDDPFIDEAFTGTLGGHLTARLLQLGLIFVAVALVTLAMSLVAHAVR